MLAQSTTYLLGKIMQGAVDTETGAVILTVDTDRLTELVQLLQRAEPATVPLTPAPARTTTRPISSLRVELAADDAVAITSDDASARITGSPAGLARLADEVRQFGDYNDLSEPGMHAHFDAEWVLARGSDSLIVAGPIPDDTPPRAK